MRYRLQQLLLEARVSRFEQHVQEKGRAVRLDD